MRNQGHDPIEHLIIDGDSTDGTQDLLRAAEETYEMSWTSEPDEGQADAVNKGFTEATGDIIGWLNSDDAYLFEDTLDTVVEAFGENPRSDVVYGNAIHINSDNRVIDAKQVRDFSYEKLLDGCFLIQPSVFFRRHVIEEERLRLDIEHALDYEYWLRLSKQYQFLHIDEFLSADRLHQDRKTLAGSDLQEAQSERIRREYGWEGDGKWGDISVSDRLFSGIPRRLAATRALFQLRSREDWALELTWDGWAPLLHRQLFPSHPSTYV